MVKKLFLILCILSLGFVSSDAGITDKLKSVVAKKSVAGGVSYTVFWDGTSTGLDVYDATDGSSTNDTGVTYSAGGAELTDNTDHVYITATDGNNITFAQGTIVFTYQNTATIAQYDRWFQLGTNVGDFRFFWNNATQVRIDFDDLACYWDNGDANWADIGDGTERTVRVTWDTTAEELKLYIAELLVGSACNITGYDIVPVGNYLNICSSSADSYDCNGRISDFYIYPTVETP